MKFGYHASHEQFSPQDLLAHAVQAEAAGFDCVMSSDHIAPWSRRQGQSGFAWAWLGAAMQATTLPFGMITVPGGWRYHPAITAQAAATLASMFPSRFRWMALGSGQALGEHITGERWPAKAERNARLEAAAGIIRELWTGATVSRDGPIRVDEATLYTLPETPPRLMGAALTPATARRVGGWADGLITVNQPLADVAAIVQAFREGGGAGKPMALQVHVSYARTDALARDHAFDQWRSNTLGAAASETLRTPDEFDAASRYVRPEDLDDHVLISADVNRQAEWLAEYAALGFEEILLHNVGRNQREFIDVFGEQLRPALERAVSGSASRAAAAVSS